MPAVHWLTMTEWNAAGYERVSALQQSMATETLALLTLNGNEQVLDVGCGNGRITTKIARLVPSGSVVGVDTSSAMVRLAEEHANESGSGNLQFQVGDARRLPFHAQFDLVVSFNALHWIPEQAQALRSCHSALKPGGLAQLRLVPKAARKSLEDVLEETRLSPRWLQYFATFHDPYLHLTAEEYAALAERNGFSVRQQQVHDKAWDFGSRPAFFAFGSVTFVEWTQHVPERERAAFITDVLDRYQSVACSRAGEEHLFRFYQMDIRLRAR